ncbi:MAG: hypothetical protein MSA90_16390 [Faecalicatena sp.]|uniref:hypothetical protein n=1 Tax=Faecalicatena sp. TaxID=2005360 RepID=UPI00258938A7|nr:hypothetical protein [Faecalicatena sp.]MCI6467031.1 hypothetical protein [Faecalicatena sp.]MDY5617448.1 hypothetical protein [Lachnospiraceae bacterium]
MFSLFNFSTDYASDTVADLVKAGAYKALLRSGIDVLPVYYKDVFDSLKYSITQIYTYSYQFLSKSTHEPLEDYIQGCGEYGAIFCINPLCYRLFYNDIWPDEVQNWVQLSLYACTELNLVPVHGLVRYEDKMDENVQNFTYHFLAPDPVLKECGIRKAKDIADTCHIPLKNALAKSRQLKHHSDISLLDVSLTYSFQNFIEEFRK